MMLRHDDLEGSTILVVEDEVVTRRALVALLNASGYDAQGAGSAEEALELLDRRNLPQMALVDLDLPGMSGIDLIQKLDRALPDFHAFLLTAASEETIDEAQRRRPTECLRKPVNVAHLLSVLKNAHSV
jgi:CheY-like chemotaxis protein